MRQGCCVTWGRHTNGVRNRTLNITLELRTGEFYLLFLISWVYHSDLIDTSFRNTDDYGRRQQVRYRPFCILTIDELDSQRYIYHQRSRSWFSCRNFCTFWLVALIGIKTSLQQDINGSLSVKLLQGSNSQKLEYDRGSVVRDVPIRKDLDRNM